MKNEMFVEFSSRSENESFARVCIASFISQLDPTMDELTEIKTVVSEVVTNAIIHGYSNEPDHYIKMSCILSGEEMTLTIEDNGIGMDDIEEKRQPLYTSKPELERSGMGFTIIENFMDKVEITSKPNNGTNVYMTKQLITSKTVSK